MSWFNGVCDSHGPLVDDACPKCPTEAEMIAAGNFYGVAYRVLDIHADGCEATKASYLGEAMERCFKAGKAAR